jgi:hypothetical protein
MTTTPLDEMGEEELLTFGGERADTIRDAEADLLRVAYRWAVLKNPDTLPASTVPGAEKARMYGGDGTPQVCEFAASELGARLGMTTWAAGQLMADALDLVHRGTDLWARVEDREVKASYARHVVKKTRHLTKDQAQYVATAVAPFADGRIPWTRFEKRVEACVAKADPKAARDKELKAQEATFAKQLRTDAHGMASFLTRAPVWMIAQITAIVSAYSAAIRDDFPELTDDQRDVLALLMLLTPGADQNPQALAETAPVVNLYVHTNAGTPGAGEAPHEGINRFEGHGPVTDDWVRQVLGPNCRFKIYPVIDIAGMAPVDAYEIPDRHRQAVQLLTPADTFPYGTNTDRDTKQIDHTVPWNPHGPPGQSGIGNYGPMSTPHHRIKTHGRWNVAQPFPGIYVWKDQYGGTYLVDNTGTRQLPTPNNALPLVVEIYRNLPDTELDWAS